MIINIGIKKIHPAGRSVQVKNAPGMGEVPAAVQIIREREGKRDESFSGAS